MGSEKVDEKIPAEGEGKWSSQTEWEANGILNEQAVYHFASFQINWEHDDLTLT